MTSTQHAKWIRSGMQWQLARPLAGLRDKLRRYGYTVYDIGNTSHMDHVPPEDHTPYSETGWPGRTPYGWVTAIDVMPQAGLPSLKDLSDQIDRDRSAGLCPWVKYMNKPTNLANTRAVHVKWQPSRVASSSGDTGHLHLSSRSDSTQVVDDYDPIARLRGITIQQTEEPMPFIAKDAKTGQYYVCDLLTSRLVPAEAVVDTLYLAKQLRYAHNPKGEVEDVEWTDDGWARLGWSEAVFGAVETPATTTAPVKVDAAAVAAALLADPALGKLIEDRAFAASQRAEGS